MQIEATRQQRHWLDDLTRREQEILRLMAEGRSNSGISELLVLSDRTVESHVRMIFLKLRLAPGDHHHRRVLAVVAYLRADDRPALRLIG